MVNKTQVLITLMVLAVSWAGPATSADTPGWIFHQDGSYIGKQDLFITTAGAVVKTSLATFIIKPKTATIIAYNDKNRTFVEMPTSEWKKTFAGYFAVTVPGAQLKKASGKATISGIAVQQYKMMANNQETDEVWSTLGGGIPVESAKAIAGFLDLSIIVGVPVKIIRGKQTDTPVKVLDTFKIDKGTVASSLFKVPTGYRKVKTEVEVLLEDSGDMGDLMQEFGESKPVATKSKPTKPPLNKK